MHRSNVVKQLKVYQAAWPNESETVQRFLDFVMSHSDCFERALAMGHITGSSWLVNRAGTHVLLTHHGTLNKWFQLGGHADGDPDIIAVAMREACEESGLVDIVSVGEQIFDVDIHEIPERKGVPAHFHYDIRYAMQTRGSEEFIVSVESHDLAWIEIDKLDQVTREESMLRMAAKWKSDPARVAGV